MRLIKMFGLAMLASVATMAFVGVGSASAQLLGSVVCHLGTPTSGGCPEGSLPYTGAILGTGLGKDTFVSGFVSVLCNGHMAGEITNAGSSTEHPLGSIKSVSWTNCEADANPCIFSSVEKVEAKAESLPWHVTVLGTATLSLGEMHISNPKGSFTITCKNGSKLTCIYDAKSVLPDTLNHTSELTTQIHATELALLRVEGSSFGCSANGTWTGLYDLTQKLSVHLL